MHEGMSVSFSQRMAGALQPPFQAAAAAGDTRAICGRCKPPAPCAPAK
jgi:hypothetical protein